MIVRLSRTSRSSQYYQLKPDHVFMESYFYRISKVETDRYTHYCEAFSPEFRHLMLEYCKWWYTRDKIWRKKKDDGSRKFKSKIMARDLFADV